MSQKILDHIKDKIRENDYVLTSHAIEEMLEDELAEVDIEEAILSGKLVRTQTDYLEREKYTIEGHSKNFRSVRAICRFSDSGVLIIIITVCEIT